MAQAWDAKSPADTVARVWTPELASGDTLQGSSATATGVTVSETALDGGAVLVTLTGGADGVGGIVTVTATTAGGLSLSEVFYIPVRAGSEQLGYTVRDACSFALRKITGGDSPNAEQLADAVERLNDMVAVWRAEGLDVGVSGVLVAADLLAIPDEFQVALKWNLIVWLADRYGNDALSQAALETASALKRIALNRRFTIADMELSRTLVQPAYNGNWLTGL